MTLQEGLNEKNAGIEIATAFERAHFKRIYKGCAETWFHQLSTGRSFTGEALRLNMEVRYPFLKPHHPNVWGALARAFLQRMLRASRVVFTNDWQQATDKKAHARCYPGYRKVA